MHILFLIFIAYAINQAPVASASSEVHPCPLTSGYILDNLEGIEKLANGDTTQNYTMLSYYIIRMAGEVLKTPEFLELKNASGNKKDTCSFFKISVNLNGMKTGSENAKPFFTKTLIKEVKKCQTWVRTTLPNSSEIISSCFCNPAPNTVPQPKQKPRG